MKPRSKLGERPHRPRTSPVKFGVVQNQAVTSSGHFVEVRLVPGRGYLTHARVAHPRGCYFPVKRGCEVVVVFVDGDYRQAVAYPMQASLPDPPPSQAIQQPDQIWITSPGRVNIVADTAVVQANAVHQGKEQSGEALARAGVATGETICPYTANGHFDCSSRVFAAKLPDESLLDEVLP